MKSTRALKATGLVLIAVVLGLLTVQGSYALWNKSASADAGTIQAADFRISLTDTIPSMVTDMTLADGTAATLSLSTTPAGGSSRGKAPTQVCSWGMKPRLVVPLLSGQALQPLSSTTTLDRRWRRI